MLLWLDESKSMQQVEHLQQMQMNAHGFGIMDIHLNYTNLCGRTCGHVLLYFLVEIIKFPVVTKIKYYHLKERCSQLPFREHLRGKSRIQECENFKWIFVFYKNDEEKMGINYDSVIPSNCF